MKRDFEDWVRTLEDAIACEKRISGNRKCGELEKDPEYLKSRKRLNDLLKEFSEYLVESQKKFTEPNYADMTARKSGLIMLERFAECKRIAFAYANAPEDFINDGVFKDEDEVELAVEAEEESADAYLDIAQELLFAGLSGYKESI